MPLPASPARIRIQDLLICLSVGNLLFLRRWYDIEQLQSRAMDYFRTGPAQNTQFWATLIAIGIAAAAFWPIALLIRRFPTGRLAKLGRAGFLVLLAVPLETVRRFWNYREGHTDLGSTLSLLAIEALLAVGVVQIVRNNARVVRAAERVALYMVVALPVFAGHYWLSHSGGDPASAWSPRSTLPMLAPKTSAGGAPQRRLIWLLFDEFEIGEDCTDQRALRLGQACGRLVQQQDAGLEREHHC